MSHDRGLRGLQFENKASRMRIVTTQVSLDLTSLRFQSVTYRQELRLCEEPGASVGRGRDLDEFL